MVGMDIERRPTQVEQADFITLGTKTIFDVFNQKVAEKVLEYNKKFKPFDEPCARLDFRDRYEKAQKESQRIYGFVKNDLKLEIGDLDKYGKEDRFELLEDQEAYVDKVIEGSRTQVIMGHTLSYKCKDRGHGISIFIPNDEYKRMKEDSNKKETKEIKEK
jgi:hypothetical protein